MTTQGISFSAPLSRAWRRMTDALFRPFEAKKWFVLGFTAWLAGLAARGGESGSRSWSEPGDLEDLGEGAGDIWQSIVDSGLLVALVGLGCIVLLGLAVAALWVSSRGRFMFLDNVVHNRALVVDPWKRFRKQGNSLFLFSLALIASCVVLIGGVILGIAGTIGLTAWNDFETAATIGIVFAAFTALGTFVLGILYTGFFLNAFVVPLMHRYDLGAIDGWRRFFIIFSKHAWAFLLCGLLVLILGLGIGILVVSFGLLTCCLGFLLLAIPYIGSVIMLPMSVFYRSFTLEFLAQFDPDLLPRDADPGTVKTLP